MSKIVFISDFFPPHIRGGAEVSTSLLAKELVKYHHVEVVTSKLSSKEWKWNSITIHPILSRNEIKSKSAFYLLKYAIGCIVVPLYNTARIHKFLKYNIFDVINLVPSSYVSFPLIIFVSIFRRNARIVIDARDYTLICISDFNNKGTRESEHRHKCVRHINSLYQNNNRLIGPLLPLMGLYEVMLFNIYKITLRFIINNDSKVSIVALSEYVKKQLTNNGYNKDKITVINNIAEGKVDHKHGLRQALIYDFIYAGRLEKPKGIWDAIHAVEQLNNPNIKFAIAGYGTEFNPIKNYIKQNNLDNVLLLGKLSPENIIDLYNKSKFVLAPVRRPEPFGRFIQEASIAQTPIIAPSIGGIPEALTDGISGYLYDPTLPKGLLNALVKAANIDDLELINMQNRMSKLSAKYSPSFICKKRFKIYFEL